MILKYGSSTNSKQAVRALGWLMLGESTDVYSAKLRDAVKIYQEEKGLTVDGIAGPETFGALCEGLPEVHYLDYSGSIYVRAAQALVGVEMDGKYGQRTRANVKAFQAAAGIDATGDVGPNCWRALWGLEYQRTQAEAGGAGAQPVDYKQYDSRWGGKVYTSCGNKSQTMRNSGCGPTAMADIVATWMNPKITPWSLAKYAMTNGYRTANSGTAWAFFPAVAKAFGFSKFVQTKSMATLRAALAEGAYAVASMGPGYWTKGGHFICVWKMDEDYVYANDPASSTRKRQKIGAFEEQRKQFFVFWK